MKRSDTPHRVSIADMIPKWFEGGTQEQMLDEALAQIRTLEAGLAQALVLNHWDRMKVAENEADDLRAALKLLAPFVDAAFVATPDLNSGERFEAVRVARKAAGL